MMGMILVLVRGIATLEYFSTVLAVDSIDAYACISSPGLARRCFLAKVF
jgi:hypothetical protein